MLALLMRIPALVCWALHRGNLSFSVAWVLTDIGHIGKYGIVAVFGSVLRLGLSVVVRE